MKRALVILILISTVFCFCRCAGEQPTEETPLPATADVTASVSETAETSETPQTSEESAQTPDVFDFAAFERQVYEEIPSIAPFIHTVDIYNEYMKRIKSDPRYTELSPSLTIYGNALRIDIFRDPLTLAAIEAVTVGEASEEIFLKLGYPNFIAHLSDKSPTTACMEKFYVLENGTILKMSFDGEFSQYMWNGETCPGGAMNYTLSETKIITFEELLADKAYYEKGSKISKQIDPREGDRVHWPFDDWPEIFVTKYGME